MKPPARTLRYTLLLAAFALLAYALRGLPERATIGDAGAPGGASGSNLAIGGDTAVGEAFRQRRSGVWLQTKGVVDKVLSDDDQGARHQRFILRLDDGHTLLISHNIDLAPRIPLAVGDPLAVRGQYEWNKRGGLIHWTHHDPAGRRAGGWIEHRGRIYK